MIKTFLRKYSSEHLDQSLVDVAAADVTAISTPLDNVPLNIVQSGKVPIILLKSSQAVSSSARLSFGAPVTICSH